MHARADSHKPETHAAFRISWLLDKQSSRTASTGIMMSHHENVAACPTTTVGALEVHYDRNGKNGS